MKYKKAKKLCSHRNLLLPSMRHGRRETPTPNPSHLPRATLRCLQTLRHLGRGWRRGCPLQRMKASVDRVFTICQAQGGSRCSVYIFSLDSWTM